MREIAKRHRRRELVQLLARENRTRGNMVVRTLYQVDLARLVHDMREEAGLSQDELATKTGTSQSMIARLEDAEYTGHSLVMLERIAVACDMTLKLRAEKTPSFDREVALV